METKILKEKKWRGSIEEIDTVQAFDSMCFGVEGKGKSVKGKLKVKMKGKVWRWLTSIASPVEL